MLDITLAIWMDGECKFRSVGWCSGRDIIYFSRLCTTGYLLGAKEKRLVEGGGGLRKFCVQFKDDLPSE